jgi:hypothetical protein
MYTSHSIHTLHPSHTCYTPLTHVTLPSRMSHRGVGVQEARQHVDKRQLLRVVVDAKVKDAWMRFDSHTESVRKGGKQWVRRRRRASPGGGRSAVACGMGRAEAQTFEQGRHIEGLRAAAQRLQQRGASGGGLAREGF